MNLHRQTPLRFVRVNLSHEIKIAPTAPSHVFTLWLSMPEDLQYKMSDCQSDNKAKGRVLAKSGTFVAAT